MNHKLETSILRFLIVSCMLIGISYASSFQLSSVYLNNTANPGHTLQPNQPEAQGVWSFNVSFNSTGQNINASIGSGAINYTDSAGRQITASYPLRIYGTLSQQKTSYYTVNTFRLVPIQTMSSYYTVGTVTQSGIYQNATPAPQCYPTGLYSEWDLYLSVQPSFGSIVNNVPVGRVCIYNETVGWAEVLPVSPIVRLFANISLYANGQHEVLQLPYNNTPAISSDRLAEAWWINQTGIALGGTAAPNGTDYVALNDSKGHWYLQNAGTYMRWYTQYYKFTQSKIPNFNQHFNPTSLGIVSSSCVVVSATQLTNQSVKNAVNCMNTTASVYYSLSNLQAAALMYSVQNLSGYQYEITNFDGSPAFAINLPARFTPNPRIRFALNGQFLGFSLPAGAPQILIVNASPVSISGTGTLTMLVENYGTTQGLFKVSINDCSGVSAEPGVSYTVGSGQVANITTSFTAPNANLTLNEQCEVQIMGANGGGNTKTVALVSQTPNEYLHNELEGAQSALCDSDGIFTEFLCQYVGIG